MIYDYEFRIYDLDNKINTAAEKQKEEMKKLSLRRYCVCTKKDTGFRSLRWNKHSQEEQKWTWGMAANALKVMGRRVLHQCNRFTSGVSAVRGGVCKAAESGRHKFLNLCCPNTTYWMGWEAQLPAARLGGLFSVSPLQKCWDSASHHPSLSKRSWNKPRKQCETYCFWNNKNP